MRRWLVDIAAALIETVVYIGVCVGIAVLLSGVIRAFLGG